jgi:hypothetical protein
MRALPGRTAPRSAASGRVGPAGVGSGSESAVGPVVWAGGLFLAVLAGWWLGMLPQLGGVAAVVLVVGRFLVKPRRRPASGPWVDPDAEPAWRPPVPPEPATVVGAWVQDVPRPAIGRAPLALTATAGGDVVWSREQVAFAVAVEQAQLMGRALGIPEEQIREDIGRGLRESQASAEDALRAVTWAWAARE